MQIEIEKGYPPESLNCFQTQVNGLDASLLVSSGIIYGLYISCDQASISEISAKQFPQVEICFSKDVVSIDEFKTARVFGTPFQREVWKALLEIPEGTTLTYSELALKIGRPGATRAVGTAIGSNRLSILIPCHRVVPKNGGVGGFLFGSKTKERLLAFEKSL